MKKGKETTKSSTKKRLSFSFFKKHKALSVSIVIIAAAVTSFLVVNYGRYVKEIVEVYYLRTKNFYFNSDKLTITGKLYEINPWKGTDVYEIPINMNSLLNSLKGSNSDIAYTASCEADDNSICYFDSRGTTSVNRTIGKTSHTDIFTLSVEVKDGVTVKDGDTITVSLTARSTSPYVEELYATFNLIIGDYGVGFAIEDEPGRMYFDATVSNTLPDESKSITLTITDPSIISIDMSNNILDDIPDSAKTITPVSEGGTTHNYITAITFDVGPKSSVMVRYFKKNTSADYTYNGTSTPIVNYVIH